MSDLVTALAPAFAAGFAIQRLSEILDAMVGGISAFGPYKKFVFSLVSLIFGLLLAFSGHLSVLKPLLADTQAAASKSSQSASSLQSASSSPASTNEAAGEKEQDKRPNIPNWIDSIITALVISGGTEGFNSLLKFLGYKKEEKKSDAAVKASAVNPTITPQAALEALNTK